MVSERQRAQKQGYPSPIHDTIEDTHACYDGNVQMALEAMARGEKVELLVASHNQVGGRRGMWVRVCLVDRFSRFSLAAVTDATWWCPRHIHAPTHIRRQASIEKALAGMGALGLEPAKSGVYFGQLLGMADHLTLSLGRHGYKAYKCVRQSIAWWWIDHPTACLLNPLKSIDSVTQPTPKSNRYVPYGRVGEVVPYLIRRAQENSDVLGGVGKELGLLKREILRRVLPF